MSTSRHVASQYQLKDVAFVEELWTFKPSQQNPDILTFEFGVRRLYRTSPTPTHLLHRRLAHHRCVVISDVDLYVAEVGH
jgi:hypothetical protein